MKRTIIFMLSMMLICTTAYSSWYVIDTETNRATSKTNYEPKKEDLEKRGEIAIYSNAVINIEDAEVYNGKIQERIKSQEEKNEEAEITNKKSDIQSLEKYIRNKYCLEMEAAGTTFKNIKCTDFK
ncbi:MAG: hypothetical protein U9O94_01345 [Nanoarchaeota archaeon]|nr:hypothetical protein [Nanoarchaeota archaeon]